jgi:hypothetical protein
MKIPPCPPLIKGGWGDLKVIFEAIIGPMTLNGDRELFTQMRIQDPHSLDLVRDGLYGPNTKETTYVLNPALKGGFLPKIRLKLRCSRKCQEMLISTPFSLSTPSLLLRSL